MRVITGSRRGLKLKTPKGLDIRPTSDRVKESVFNIIGNRVIGTTVLDLFAGTGNLGIEALSRGAEKVIFTDQSSTSLNLTKANVSLAKFMDRAEFYRMGAVSAMETFAKKGIKFDLIFCDPPYNQGLVMLVLKKLDEASLLSSDGLIVMEHSGHEPIVSDFSELYEARVERYGETVISFLCKHKNGGN
ncbi:MAG: methyltransferase [Firmicutes bacterium]|nr:methyltransferase [Bacillota bacterium]